MAVGSELRRDSSTTYQQHRPSLRPLATGYLTVKSIASLVDHSSDGGDGGDGGLDSGRGQGQGQGQGQEFEDHHKILPNFMTVSDDATTTPQTPPRQSASPVSVPAACGVTAMSSAHADTTEGQVAKLQDPDKEEVGHSPFET